MVKAANFCHLFDGIVSIIWIYYFNRGGHLSCSREARLPMQNYW